MEPLFSVDRFESVPSPGPRAHRMKNLANLRWVKHHVKRATLFSQLQDARENVAHASKLESSPPPASRASLRETHPPVRLDPGWTVRWDPSPTSNHTGERCKCGFYYGGGAHAVEGAGTRGVQWRGARSEEVGGIEESLREGHERSATNGGLSSSVYGEFAVFAGSVGVQGV